MISMKTAAGAELTGAGTVSSREFTVDSVGVVFFGVTGRTGGTVTIMFKAHDDAIWTALDSTNLVFSADGFAYAVVGAGKIRADGTDATTGDKLFVGIAGDYVYDPTGVS